MDKCPITGAPCSNPKIIHVTDVGPGYSAENAYDLCQVCAMGKAQQQQPPEQKAPLHPFVKSLFDMLSLILTAKKQAQQVQPPPPELVVPQQQPLQKPPCPTCGTTIQDIVTTQRLGCPHCYEYYKIELLPVLIHAHKSAEHVGKQPKRKGPCFEDLPAEEQVRILEMQIKLAADQELYEKAKELKDKLTAIKASLESSPDSE